MKATILVVSLCAVFVGCGSGSGYSPKKALPVEVATVKAGQEKSLFPVKVGNQWVYTVISGNTSREITLKVTKVSERDGATFAKVASSSANGQSSVSECRDGHRDADRLLGDSLKSADDVVEHVTGILEHPFDWCYSRRRWTCDASESTTRSEPACETASATTGMSRRLEPMRCSMPGKSQPASEGWCPDGVIP